MDFFSAYSLCSGRAGGHDARSEVVLVKEEEESGVGQCHRHQLPSALYIQCLVGQLPQAKCPAQENRRGYWNGPQAVECAGSSVHGFGWCHVRSQVAALRHRAGIYPQSSYKAGEATRMTVAMHGKHFSTQSKKTLDTYSANHHSQAVMEVRSAEEGAEGPRRIRVSFSTSRRRKGPKARRR